MKRSNGDGQQYVDTFGYEDLINGTEKRTGGKRPRLSCSTEGFASSTSKGCTCNFAGACDSSGTPVSSIRASGDWAALSGFAPGGMDAFAQTIAGGPGTTATGTVCEKNTVAILYDCSARIPLYSAAVLKGPDVGGRFELWHYFQF